VKQAGILQRFHWQNHDWTISAFTVHYYNAGHYY